MKETKNYKLKLPEQADNIDIDVLDGNFTELDRLIFEKVKEILEAVGKKADTVSPTLTGTPKSPTPTSTDNSTRIATTAFVQGLISGLASASSVSSLSGSLSSLSGVVNKKANIDSPAFTGEPTAPTPDNGNFSNSIATTEFVKNMLSLYVFGLAMNVPFMRIRFEISEDENDMLIYCDGVYAGKLEGYGSYSGHCTLYLTFDGGRLVSYSEEDPNPETSEYIQIDPMSEYYYWLRIDRNNINVFQMDQSGGRFESFSSFNGREYECDYTLLKSTE